MVSLHVRPKGLRAAWRYQLAGGPLLRQLAVELARSPHPLLPAERQWRQQGVARRLLAHLQVRLTVHGLNEAQGGAFIIVALHESMLDPLLLMLLPLPLRFAARNEIFGWPLIGPAITGLGHLSITPECGIAAYRTLLREGERILNGGESLALFPQGSVLGLETAFQPGAFALARTLGTPILPVVLTGGHRVWEHPFAPVLRYGQRLGMRVLPPISAEQVRASTSETLRTEVQRRMKAAALHGDLPPPRRYLPERDGWWDGYRFDIDPAFLGLAHRLAERRAAFPGDSR